MTGVTRQLLRSIRLGAVILAVGATPATAGAR